MKKVAKGWGQWSTKERVAAIVLISVLAIFTVVWVLVLYEPPTGPGLCGAFGAEPCPGTEAINFISQAMNSPTNMTVEIVNSGSAQTSLISYYVKSTNGQTYANTNWSGPTLAPSQYVDVNLLIDGNAFTFHSGSYYTVTLITVRNNQFTGSIQA